MEKRGRRSLKERGFRLIVVSSKVYDKLMELKGGKSFNKFMLELIDIYTASQRGQSVYIQKPVESEKPKLSVSIQAEAKPSMEYRSHLCRGCSFDAKGVEQCRIRQYQYILYGLECPRQEALKASPK
jgi:predicted CopG family antitoxin